MTAILLTPDETAIARRVAREIGTAFRQARTAAGDTKKDVAMRLQMHQGSVGSFELGRHHNLKLGNAIRLLGVYGLTLAVVRDVPRGTYENMHEQALIAGRTIAVPTVDCDPFFAGELS